MRNIILHGVEYTTYVYVIVRGFAILIDFVRTLQGLSPLSASSDAVGVTIDLVVCGIAGVFVIMRFKQALAAR